MHCKPDTLELYQSVSFENVRIAYNKVTVYCFPTVVGFCQLSCK